MGRGVPSPVMGLGEHRFLGWPRFGGERGVRSRCQLGGGWDPQGLEGSPGLLWDKWGAGSVPLSKKRGGISWFVAVSVVGERSRHPPAWGACNSGHELCKPQACFCSPSPIPPLLMGDISTLTCPTGTHVCSQSTHWDGADLSRPHCPPFISLSLPTPDGRSGS